MISMFRNFAKSKWAAGLLVLVALALLVTGGSQFDVIGALTPRHVIDAGDRKVTQQQFRADFDRVRENLSQQQGKAVTVEDMVEQNILSRYLADQSRRLGFLAWAWDAGIRPGKALVLKEIRKVPAFFDDVTGQFSEETYKARLAQVGITPAEAEQEFRDQYAVQHYAAALSAGARLPRVYGALIANQALENRDARWFSVTQAMAGSPPAPTDAQLTAFMRQNAAQLRMPEFRTASVVLFSDATAPAVSEEKVQERFNFRKDALSQPEQRSFVTLTAPNRAAADKIAAALRAGQTPQQAGATANIQPATYADKPRSVLSDPAVAAAVFGLPVNQVSDPVQGRVGFTVAQVSKITPGRPVTLADVRPQIVQELQAEAARAATYARVEAYEKARQSGQNLDQAAQAVGARIIRLPAFTQDGRRRADGQPLNAPPQLLEQAWKLGKGGESDVIDAGQGQYFVLRVDEITPAAMPPLAEIRGPLAAEWTRRENARLLTAKADALAAQVRQGKDIAAVAASVNAPVQTRTGLQQNQQVQEAVGEGVLRGLFNANRGEVFTGPASATSYVVGRVDRISAPTAALAAPIASQVRPRLSQDVLQAMGERAITFAAEKVKATWDLAQARLALGLSAEAPEAPAAPATAPAR